MNQIWALIDALVELVKLYKILKKRIDEANIDRKVADDIKTIHEAFDTKDAEKLNALFAHD